MSEDWARGEFGRCMARAKLESERKARERVVRGRLDAWQLADGFLLGDMEAHRPTENEAMVRAFYGCVGWRLVARAWADAGREQWERGHWAVALMLGELAREAEGMSKQMVLMAV